MCASFDCKHLFDNFVSCLLPLLPSEYARIRCPEKRAIQISACSGGENGAPTTARTIPYPTQESGWIETGSWSTPFRPRAPLLHAARQRAGRLARHHCPCPAREEACVVTGNKLRRVPGEYSAPPWPLALAAGSRTRFPGAWSTGTRGGCCALPEFYSNNHGIVQGGRCPFTGQTPR